jgi:hypothetical protein
VSATGVTATELDAALEEIQSNANTKVNESGGTLTNGYVVSPARLDVKRDTYTNLLSYAASFTPPNGNGQLCFAIDTKSMYQVVDGNLVSVGSGSATSDTVFVLDGTELISNWSTGNNSSFLGGGTISGTFAKETVAPLNGLSSYKYTQAAGSLNDYIASPAQSVANRFKGQDCILSFPFNYNGNNNDIEVVVYNVTNSTVIPTSFFLEGSSSTKVFKGYVTIPTTCSSIRIGFKVAVSNSTKVLNFDDIQLGQTSLYNPQPDYENISLTNGSIAASAIITNFTVSKNTNKGILSYSSGRITALKTCIIDVNYTARSNASGVRDIQLIKNGTTTVASTTMQANSYTAAISYSEQVLVGDYFEFRTDSNGINNASVYCTAAAVSDQILTAPETFSTDTAPLIYAGSGTYTPSTLSNAPIGTFITYTFPANSYTPTQTTTAPTQFASGYADANSNGIRLFAKSYGSLSTAALPARISLQIGKGMKGVTVNGYSATSKTTPFAIDTIATSSNSFGPCITYNELTGILDISVAEMILSTGSTKFVGYDSLGGGAYSSGYFVINASKSPALTGVPLLQPRIAVLTGINAATPVASTYVTRTLTTLNDPTAIVTSLASNQFTLTAGTYSIMASATHHRTNSASSRIRNITDGISAISGIASYASTASVTGFVDNLSGIVTINSTKTFELQSIAESSASASYGIAAGSDYVNAQVTIQKIK